MLIPVSTGTWFLVRGFTHAFVYRDIGIWNGVLAPASVLVIFVALACVVAYYIIKPFDEVISRIRKKGEMPTNEEKSKCLAVYRKIVVMLFALNFFGFIVGQVVVALVRDASDSATSSIIHTIAAILYATSAGMMAAGIETLGFNEILAPFRRLLQIHTVESVGDRKAVRFASSTYLLFFTSILFVFVNTAVVPLGLISKLQYSSENIWH